MPRRLPLALLALLFLNVLAVVPSTETAAAPAQDFKALMRKVADAWETLDPAKAAPFYAKEADRVFYDTAPLKYAGWANYAAGAGQSLANYSSAKITLADDVRAQQRGNLAWATATWRWEGSRKDGGTVMVEGRTTVVWEKRGKDWLIVHQHVSAPLPLPPPGERSLYQRLGGYDAIAAVTDDFLGRLVSDKQLARFFTGASDDSKRRIRQLVVDQLCMATGGPCVYIGRSMKASHEGLGITEADWQAAVAHLVATLDKFNVPKKEKDELLAIASSLERDIVTIRHLRKY